MNITGIQKLTLLDFPKHTACTLFTPGCNLRCPFCHNAALVISPESDTLSIDDVLAFLRKRRNVLDGVAITGGEPLLQADIADFIRMVRTIGYAVKLDTNGFFPERLEPLIRENLLDYIAVDIKNSPQKYAATVGREGIDLAPLYRTVELLKSCNIDYEFRTTVSHPFHEPSDFTAIGELISGAPYYYIQQFIDSGELIGSGITPLNKDETDLCLSNVQRYIPTAELRGI